VPTEPENSRPHALAEIYQNIVAAAGGEDYLHEAVSDLLRNCIDDVIKTPKTGRRFYHELQNSEKTYIGTVVEIELRERLSLHRGQLLDLKVNGVEVDVKFSASTAWMIPPEAVNHPCLLISANETTSVYDLGLFLADPAFLTAPNRDQKRGISALGRASALWAFRRKPYPANFWATVSPETATRISMGRSGNERMVTLFREVLDRPINRRIVQSVASQADFMRRLRDDGGRGTPSILASEGILLLCGTWASDQQLIQQLNLPTLTSGHFLSHRLTEREAGVARALGFRV
jgi:hypothetical protein